MLFTAVGAISEGRSQVNELIKNLNQKGGLKKVQHREHIKKFAHFYREHKPGLSVDDIKFLLQGTAGKANHAKRSSQGFENRYF